MSYFTRMISLTGPLSQITERQGDVLGEFSQSQSKIFFLMLSRKELPSWQ